MKTNFFQIVNQLQSAGTCTIHIAKNPSEEDKLIVSVLFSEPKCSKAGINLIPMLFNETPVTLDESFFPNILSPMNEAGEVFINSTDFNKSLEKAKKSTTEKSKTIAPPTPKEDDSIERKKQYDQAMAKIDELKGMCKYADAIAILPNETDHPTKKTELQKLRTELESNNKQLSLYNT